MPVLRSLNRSSTAPHPLSAGHGTQDLMHAEQASYLWDMFTAPKMLNLTCCLLLRCTYSGVPGFRSKYHQEFGFSKFELPQRCSYRDWINLKVLIRKSQCKRKEVDDGKSYLQDQWVKKGVPRKKNLCTGPATKVKLVGFEAEKKGAFRKKTEEGCVCAKGKTIKDPVFCLAD